MRNRVLVVSLAVAAGVGAVLLSPGPGASFAAQDDGVRMLGAEGEAQQYWSRWRGPSGQGLVNGTGYPDTWSDTENVLWRVTVPGSGNSSPIVWGDRIFLTTAYNDGTRISLLSFDRANGELLWETAVPFAEREFVHQKNGHASATAITDGDLIYASFGHQGLMAVDFDGNMVWHQRPAELDNYWGAAGSPILYKDSVILYQDHRGASFVAAFDKATGETIWRTDREASTGWGTPIIIDAGTRDELVVSSQGKVYSYDPNSGEELWTVDGNLFEVIPTPVVGHGMVFCSSGRAGPTMAIRPGGSGDVTESHVAWKTPKGSPFVPSALVVGDYLYLINDMMSIVTAYEAKSGKLLFQGRLGRASRESFSGSPVAVDGKVFFTNDEGQTFVVEAGSEFNLLHVNELNARTIASPALVDGKWYFRTESELIAIGNE